MRREQLAAIVESAAEVTRAQLSVMDALAQALRSPEPIDTPQPEELTCTELIALLRTSRTRLYLLRRNDPTFPRAVQGPRGSLRFIRAEVKAWLSARKRVDMRRAS